MSNHISQMKTKNARTSNKIDNLTLAVDSQLSTFSSKYISLRMSYAQKNKK